jgi:hypothetical protein
MFSFLRSLHIVFQYDCSSLHFYQQCIRVPVSLASLPAFVGGGVPDDSHHNMGEVES